MSSPGAQRSARPHKGTRASCDAHSMVQKFPQVSHEAQGRCGHNSRTPLTMGVLGGQNGNERVEHWSHVLKSPEHLNFKLDTSLPWQVSRNVRVTGPVFWGINTHTHTHSQDVSTAGGGEGGCKSVRSGPVKRHRSPVAVACPPRPCSLYTGVLTGTTLWLSS